MRWNILGISTWATLAVEENILKKIIGYCEMRNHDFDIEFGILVSKAFFKISKSLFPIPLETHFETKKIEISVTENPKIYFSAPKF